MLALLQFAHPGGSDDEQKGDGKDKGDRKSGSAGSTPPSAFGLKVYTNALALAMRADLEVFFRVTNTIIAELHRVCR